MFRRTFISIYKFYNVNKPNNYFNSAPLKRLVSVSTANMSTNKIVGYDDVLSATKNTTIYIIDVREPSELKDSGKIPNSINIPLAEVEDALKNDSDDKFKAKYGRAKPNAETPIIFSCRSGKRAGTALETALKLGFKNSKSYGGSWLDWEKH